jgi:molybdate transport system substrate-binding protein
VNPVGRLAFAVVATIAFTGCGSDNASTVAMVPSSFTGLTDAVDTGIGTEVDWIIAGSSRLVRQLADGATADLLITADAETMHDAVDQGLVAGDPVTIARNRLVVALAPGNPGGIDEPDDLVDADLLIGVCAVEVPCGRLTARVRIESGLELAVDTEEPNVRSLALKISRGELDAGLVYATDASDLGLATLPADTVNEFETEYLAASVDGEPSPIIDYLRSPDGRELLTRKGFLLP